MAKSDPFLKALLSSGNNTPSYSAHTPVPSQSGTSFNFASYFNNKANKIATNPTEVGLASQGEQKEQSVFGKATSWLGSLGLGVENVAQDLIDQNYKGIPADLAGAWVHGMQPVIDFGPIKVPWEHKVADFAYKENVQHHGKEQQSGANILRGLGINNKVADALGGFAIDIATDPTTYMGVGLPKALGKLKGVLDVATETASAGTKGEKATLAVERGRQAAQEAGFAKLGIGKDIVNPSKNIRPKLNIATTDKGADLGSSIKKIISESPESPIENRIIPVANDLKPGMAKIQAARGIAVTKTGKFNPLIVQKVINNVARQGGTLAPVATPISSAVGPRAVQAVSVARNFAAKATKGKNLKPSDQVKLFNNLFSTTSYDKDVLRLTGNKAETSLAKVVRANATLPMLKSAEEALQKLGYQFHDWNGSGLKLSDVAQEIPKERFAEDLPKVVKAFNKKSFDKVIDPNVQNYVANAMARRNLAVGTAAKDMYDKIALQAADQQIALSPAKYRDWLNNTAKNAYDTARPLGFTEKEAEAFKQLIVSHSTLNDIANLDAYEIIDKAGPKLARSFFDGKRDAQAIAQINKAIAKNLNIPYGKAGKILLPVANVNEAMAYRFTTWYGRGAMFDKSKSEFTLAQNLAKSRNEWIGNMRKGYTSEQVNNAWMSLMRPVDQVVDGLLDSKTAELASKFRDYLDSIVGPDSRLGKQVAQSTAINSQMIASDLNRHLGAVGSKFRVKPDSTGDWLNSIYDFKVVGKKADGLDPTTFLYNYDLAIQRTLAEYNLVDDFAMRFGAKPGTAEFNSAYHTHEIVHSRAAGYKFEQKTAQEFNRLLEDLRKGSWRPNGELTNFLATALRKWKGGVTIYYPAHHIRNLVGDMWLMWASGINNPGVFSKSMRVIGSQRQRYAEALKDPDIMKLQSMIEPGGTGWIQTEGKNIITSKRGVNITADEYYHEAQNRGILLDAQRIEDLQGDALTGGRSISRPFAGKLHASLAKISEYREHYVRLAHLIGYVEKNLSTSVAKKLAATEGPLERSKIMSDLFDKAAADIRKWHPDGTDLTYWEQKYMRNIAPFYSWTRKSIPLLLESMMLRPAKVLAYPRATFAVQTALGINAPGPYQPFPDDQLYPDWLQGAGIGPIGNPASDNPVARFFGKLGTNAIGPNGQETGYTIVNPGGNALPESMIGQFLGMGSPGELKQGLAESLNPFARIGSELLTGTQTSGAPIGKADEGNGYLAYALGQLPQTAPIQRLTQVGKKGQQNREPGPNWEALLNALTAAGVTGSGKYTTSAEFDAKARAKRQGK